MKLIALVAMLPAMSAMAGSAYAGIATSFSVNSGVHYVLNDQGPNADGKVLTPFGGTLRSDLSPLSKCRSTYSATTHTSSCSFIDQSDWETPYNEEYLGQFKTDAPLLGGLVSRVQVKKDGSYLGYFMFSYSKDEIEEDASGSYANSFNTFYLFRFRGTGMAWDTTLDASLAEEMWHRESMFEKIYSIQRYRNKIDPLTGEEGLSLDSERWDGTVNLAAVPEPAGLALFGIGLAAVAVLRRRKKCSFPSHLLH